MALKVLGLVGSTRKGSFNQQFLTYTLGVLAEKGVEVSTFDAKANPLPLFDQDLEAEEGFPASVLALKQAIAEADAVIFANPEYNASVTPLGKNLIDWASRGGQGQKNEWDSKPILLISASPGPLGGIRGLSVVRPSFMNCSALILSEQVALGSAHDAYNEDGSLKDARTAGFLSSALDKLITITTKLKS